MVIYHVNSEYNVFQAYVHSLRFHASEKAVLLIGTPGEIRMPRYLRGNNRLISHSYVEKCKTLFEQVILCNNPPDYYENDRKFEDCLSDYYLDIFEKENIEVKTITMVYSFCSFERFSVFCMYNAMPLTIVEAEPGTVSVTATIRDFESKFFEHKHKYISRYNLYLCDTDKLKARLCNFEAQEDGVNLEGWTDFNPYRELNSLSEEQIAKLESFYDVKQALDDIDGKTLLIAGTDILNETDPYVNHGHTLYTEEKHAMAHNLILDYFTDGEEIVVISGINNHYDYKNICGLAKNFIQNTPSELIAYFVKGKNCKVISALRQDGYCFKDNDYVEITTRFAPDWQKYRFFDSAVECDVFMKLVKSVNTSNNYKVRFNNISNIIRKLYDVYFDDVQKFIKADVKTMMSDSIVFVNDGSLNEKGLGEIPKAVNDSENTIYFFANQREMFIFKDKNINYKGKFLSFSINKIAKSEKPSLYLGNRKIWVYCTDAKLAEAIESFTYSRMFSHCGVEVSCRCDASEVTDSIIEKVIVPKSVLSATKVVLYGSTTGISRYYEKIKAKYGKVYVCNFENESETMGAEHISFETMVSESGIFVLIAADSVNAMQGLSMKLQNAKVAYDHCEHHITGNTSIFRLIAMKRFDYTDERNNHYIIDNRLKLDDAKKMFVGFMNGKTKYFNTFNIGMIRIGENLKITLKGDYNTISIGNDTTFRSTSVEICHNAAVNIGERCMFSYSIVLYRDDMHNIYDKDSMKRLNYPKDLNIGNHVWVGREVLLLGGANIGDNCVIGARCVTSSKFESNTVIAGCPGRAVRKNIVWSRDGYDAGGSTIYDNFDRMAFNYMDENEDDFI